MRPIDDFDTNYWDLCLLKRILSGTGGDQERTNVGLELHSGASSKTERADFGNGAVMQALQVPGKNNSPVYLSRVAKCACTCLLTENARSPFHRKLPRRF